MMDAQTLKSALQEFFDRRDVLGVNLYAMLRGEENEGFRKLDVSSDDDSLANLKTLFLDSIQESVLDNDEVSVMDLSSSDERLDAIYRYDIEVPEDLAYMESVTLSDSEVSLNLTQNELSKIKSLIVEIGDNESQVVLYKTMAAINIFGRSGFFLKKSNTRLEQIQDEFLRVSPGFQLMRVAGEILVFDLKVIEQSFGFKEIIKKEAALGIKAIKDAAIVQNVDVLNELLDDIKYARKFTKVASSSPVLKAGVPNTSIIKFCKQFPKLKGRIRFSEDETQISLDTKVSKDLFIKVLMDDFLTSELTQFHYDSVAKDSADVDDSE